MKKPVNVPDDPALNHELAEFARAVGLTAGELGRFTDDDWLKLLAAFGHVVSPAGCAAAVELVLIEERA